MLKPSVLLLSLSLPSSLSTLPLLIFFPFTHSLISPRTCALSRASTRSRAISLPLCPSLPLLSFLSFLLSGRRNSCVGAGKRNVSPTSYSSSSLSSILARALAPSLCLSPSPSRNSPSPLPLVLSHPGLNTLSHGTSHDADGRACGVFASASLATCDNNDLYLLCFASRSAARCRLLRNEVI